jgi:predicted XRE-type DNA-binding protein
VSKGRFSGIGNAIDDTPVVAENMKIRSELMMVLTEHIKSHKLSQSEAARLFGVTQPRVSDLVRGKINLFGLDSLINMVAAAGLHVEVRVKRHA